MKTIMFELVFLFIGIFGLTFTSAMTTNELLLKETITTTTLFWMFGGISTYLALTVMTSTALIIDLTKITGRR